MDPDGPFADESMEIIDFAEQEESFMMRMKCRTEKSIFLQEKARRLMESGDFNDSCGIA